eukprot:145774_1
MSESDKTKLRNKLCDLREIQMYHALPPPPPPVHHVHHHHHHHRRVKTQVPHIAPSHCNARHAHAHPHASIGAAPSHAAAAVTRGVDWVPPAPPRLYHYKTVDIDELQACAAAAAADRDDELISKLIAHQNEIQNLINHCLHSLNRLHKVMESSLLLVETEFNKMIRCVNEKRNQMIEKVQQLVSTKFNRINQLILWLKEHRHVSSLTLNDCMQLINKPNSTRNIKTMVDNLLANQDIPSHASKLKIDDDIKLKFNPNHTSHIAAVLSTFGSITGGDVQMEEEEEGKTASVAPSIAAPSSYVPDMRGVAMIDDLSVVDITTTSAVVTWRGSSPQPGFYVNLNIWDMNYEENLKLSDAKRYVVRKTIKLERDNAIYCVNLSGLRVNNRYKIEFNVKHKRNVVLRPIFEQFDTKKNEITSKKIEVAVVAAFAFPFRFGIPANEITSKNKNRFFVSGNGKSVTLRQYDSGTILYGEYLDCCCNKWNMNSVTIKLSNISPSGFGVGFAQNTFNEYDGWNTGQNDSVIIYGNGEFYTSDAFMHSNPQYRNKNGTKLFPLDFMTRNDIITLVANKKNEFLQIMNVTRNKKIELNLNPKYVKTIAIILWFGWTNGQSVTITNQVFK